MKLKAGQKITIREAFIALANGQFVSMSEAIHKLGHDGVYYWYEGKWYRTSLTEDDLLEDIFIAEDPEQRERLTTSGALRALSYGKQVQIGGMVYAIRNGRLSARQLDDHSCWFYMPLHSIDLAGDCYIVE